MGRKIGSKNKLKQTQKQSQVVNVNITQEKKVVKRKPRTKKPSKEPPTLYEVGEPLSGRPSDNSLYTRPPIIAQVIPQIGRDSQALLPPKDTGVESVLANIRNRTENILEKQKVKSKLTDTGSNEILNIPPKIKDVGTEPTKTKRKPLHDLGSTDVFEIKPKETKEIGTDPSNNEMTDTLKPKILKLDKNKISKKKSKDLYLKTTQGMTMNTDLQTDNVPVVQKEFLTSHFAPPSPDQTKKEYKQRAQKIIDSAPVASSSMSELISKKSITAKYSDISGNKEKRQRVDEKVKKDKEEGAKLSKRLSDVADTTTKQLYGSNHPLNIENNKIDTSNISDFLTKKEKKEQMKKMKKEKFKVFTLLDRENKDLESEKATKLRQKEDLESEQVVKKKQKDAINLLGGKMKGLLTRESQQAMKKRQKEDEIKLKEMEEAKTKQIKDDAAAKVQAVIKRKNTTSIKKIKESFDILSSKTKALLTTKVDAPPFYKIKVPKREYNNSGIKNDYHDKRGFITRTTIRNKFVVGDPLVVNKRQQLVSKKKSSAAVEGYENRLAYLDMADKYKGVMTKGKSNKKRAQEV